jgi:hypothetical protein
MAGFTEAVASARARTGARRKMARRREDDLRRIERRVAGILTEDVGLDELEVMSFSEGRNCRLCW